MSHVKTQKTNSFLQISRQERKKYCFRFLNYYNAKSMNNMSVKFLSRMQCPLPWNMLWCERGKTLRLW